ncbi:hypothetical protein [Deinococcus sp. QL22]|nr:hypothetical protein [Deinococcus sp. QL22]UQN08131.1 hypothetical protein M1R55_18785 [Deinococcus sp. QL22]
MLTIRFGDAPIITSVPLLSRARLHSDSDRVPTQLRIKSYRCSSRV